MTSSSIEPATPSWPLIRLRRPSALVWLCDCACIKAKLRFGMARRLRFRGRTVVASAPSFNGLLNVVRASQPLPDERWVLTRCFWRASRLRACRGETARGARTYHGVSRCAWPAGRAFLSLRLCCQWPASAEVEMPTGFGEQACLLTKPAHGRPHRVKRPPVS